jgi:hypothetical protein
MAVLITCAPYIEECGLEPAGVRVHVSRGGKGADCHYDAADDDWGEVRAGGRFVYVLRFLGGMVMDLSRSCSWRCIGLMSGGLVNMVEQCMFPRETHLCIDGALRWTSGQLCCALTFFVTL